MQEMELEPRMVDLVLQWLLVYTAYVPSIKTGVLLSTRYGAWPGSEFGD